MTLKIVYLMLHYQLEQTILNIEITFKNSTLAVKDLNKSFYVIKTTECKINNKTLCLDLTSCDLYDISGKLIFSNQLAFYLFILTLRDGVYIVKMVTSDKIETGTKIIVKN
jgi:hypothetical protein